MNYANILKGIRFEPLYVQRKLMNSDEFTAWAKAQGFDKVVAPEELHVTICYSSEALAWPNVDGPDPAPMLQVVMGGERTVKPLGDGGAVVLTFESTALEKRWGDYRLMGASWDYEGYTPHVTITYKNGDMDLSRVQPYVGTLIFGPEILEPLVDDYAETVVEKMEFAKILANKP